MVGIADNHTEHGRSLGFGPIAVVSNTTLTIYESSKIGSLGDCKIKRPLGFSDYPILKSEADFVAHALVSIGAILAPIRLGHTFGDWLLLAAIAANLSGWHS